MCHNSFWANLALTVSTDFHVTGMGAGGCVISVSRDRDGADGGLLGCCAGGATKVSLVMMLVGTLAAPRVKLTLVATWESCCSVMVYCVQEWSSLW